MKSYRFPFRWWPAGMTAAMILFLHQYFAANKPLILTARLRQSRIVAGAPVELELELTNRGELPLSIGGPNFTSEFVLTVEAGGAVPDKLILPVFGGFDTCGTLPWWTLQSGDSQGYLVVFSHGRLVQGLDPFSGGVLVPLFPQPGTYRLTLLLKVRAGAVHDPNSIGPKAWSTRIVTSAPLDLTVAPPSPAGRGALRFLESHPDLWESFRSYNDDPRISEPFLTSLLEEFAHDFPHSGYDQHALLALTQLYDRRAAWSYANRQGPEAVQWSERAVRCGELVLRDFPRLRDDETHLLLASSYRRLGRGDEMREHLRQILNRNPISPFAPTARQLLDSP